MGEYSGRGFRDRWIDLGAFIAAWAANFLMPRLAYRLRWASRLTGGPLAAYVALRVARGMVRGMAVSYWLLPLLRRTGEEHERQRERLRAELGREPTDEELFECRMEQQRRETCG